MVKNTFKSPAFQREPIAGEKYDAENIKIIRFGKEVNLQQMIQDANVDCEIYEVLEKYGSLKPIEVNMQELHADFGEINGLRDLKDKELKAKAMWDNLPIEIRSQFENNRYKFMQDGEQWLNDQIMKAKQQIAETETPAETKE